MITQYTIPVQNCQLHSAERAVIIEKNVNRKGETDHETCSADCREFRISPASAAAPPRWCCRYWPPWAGNAARCLPPASPPTPRSGQREGHLLDLTGQMAGTAAHWAELGVTFDAIYSGFLGSAGQIGLIEDFYRQFRREGTLVLGGPG